MIRDEYTRKAMIHRVVDGDTIDVIIDLGFDLTAKLRVRLAGINAPEIHGESAPLGKAAMLWLTELLVKNEGRTWIKTVKDKKEKYGRYLAHLFVDGSEQSVNDQMIVAGHAVPFMGDRL